MAINGKKTVLHATAGILIALLIITSVAVSGLVPGLRLPWFIPPVSSTGTLVVMLTDAPVNLTLLNVTVNSITAHRQGYGNGTWVNLTFVEDKPEVSFDLITLEDKAVNISVTEIPLGNYTMIKMHIKKANATYADGNTTLLDVPSEYIKVIIHFPIEAAGTTYVLIDMEVDWVAVSHSKKLRPVLKATILPN